MERTVLGISLKDVALMQLYDREQISMARPKRRLAGHNERRPDERLEYYDKLMMWHVKL